MWPAKPAMFSTHAMPSSSALCASMGPSITSPKATTEGTLVRKCSSTWTRPSLSVSMPRFSSPSPSVKGRRRVAAFRRGVRQRHALLGDFRRLHRGLELELHALLLEQPQKGLAYVFIRPGHDVVQKLDHGHLGAQSPPDRAHLEADHAVHH